MIGLSSVKSFFGTDSPKRNIISSIDIVTYAASLVSNPQLINPTLDKVREITSRLDPNNISLSPGQQTILMQVYLEIEKYLLEKEPVRKFTKESLRQKVHEKFKLNEASTFWPNLPS